MAGRSSPWRCSVTEAGQQWPQRLRDLAAGIRSNVPRSNNPDAFHERKSELEHDAMTIADEIEKHVTHAGGGHR